VKGINKTDVVSLSSTFESLANMATASKDDLALLPGFGPLKVFDLPLTVQKLSKYEKFNFRRTKLYIFRELCSQGLTA